MKPRHGLSLFAVGVAVVILVAAVVISSSLDSSDDKAREQVLAGCEAANPRNAYFLKRAQSLTGSTKQDRDIAAWVLAIRDCGAEFDSADAGQIPLSPTQRDLYVERVFRCGCRPDIEDGQVVGP